jgi:hypothetical protein
MYKFEAKWIASLAISGSLLCGSTVLAGCKKSAPPASPSIPVQNSDGTVSTPNGTVTAPAGSGPAQQESTQPKQYAVRNADGSITNPNGSVTFPEGSKVADKENAPNGASSASSPAPAPIIRQPAPPPPPSYPSVPVGTSFVVRTNGTLSAHDNAVGDRWNGSLERPLIYHGRTVFDRGTAVSGEVVSSKGVGRFKGAGDIGIEVTDIGGHHVDSSDYEKSRKGRGKRSAGFLAGGGGLGAIIGGLAGGGKGALIGGLAGAGGGAAAGSFTGNTNVVIPAESVITFRLRSSLDR